MSAPLWLSLKGLSGEKGRTGRQIALQRSRKLDLMLESQSAHKQRVLTTLTLVFGLAAGFARTSANDLDRAQPLEPEVVTASGEASASMSGIRLPAGWEIELVAAEPQVANIVAFDIDHRGRIYVCETFRQNRGVTDNRADDERWLLADLASQTVQDRIDYHKQLLGEAAITYCAARRPYPPPDGFKW